MKYNSIFTCSELDTERYKDFCLISDSQYVKELLVCVGIPEKYRNDITAAIVLIGDGDYIAVFLTEFGNYYDYTAWYHPLPFYGLKKNASEYWLKSNPY